MRFLLGAILGLMLAGSNSSTALAAEPEPLSVLDRPLLWFKFSTRVSVSFSPDGRTLACGSSGMFLVDLESGQVRSVDPSGRPSFLPDGKSLIQDLDKDKLALLRVPTLARERILPKPEWSNMLAVSNDSQQVALARLDGVIELLNLATGKAVQTLGSQGPVQKDIALSPDGKLLAAIDDRGQFAIYERITGKLFLSTKVKEQSRGSLRFSSDSGTVALLTSDYTGTALYLWDVYADEHPTRILPPPELIGKPRVAFTIIGPASENVPRHQEPEQAKPPSDVIYGRSQISPDLSLVASELENGRIALWNVATRKTLHILPTNRVYNRVFDLSFSPDGNSLAFSNFSGHVQWWRIRGDRQPLDLPQPTEIDKPPGPWGETAIDGLRTRVYLHPAEENRWRPTKERPANSPALPMHEGIRWEVRIQVRNETDQERFIEGQDISRPNALVITREDGTLVPYCSTTDARRVERFASGVAPQINHYTMNHVLLGGDYDLSRPGKYRIQFPRTESRRPYPEKLTNPVLPASNVLEFVNEGPDVEIK